MRPDFRLERSDFRPERPDSRPERQGGGTNGRTDGRTNERTFVLLELLSQLKIVKIPRFRNIMYLHLCIIAVLKPRGESGQPAFGVR